MQHTIVPKGRGGVRGVERLSKRRILPGGVVSEVEKRRPGISGIVQLVKTSVKAC